MDEALSVAVKPAQVDVNEPVAVKEEGDRKPAQETSKAGSAGSTGGQSFGASLQGLTDSALHFLSHASNETLGACLVGLGASTYLILGRVGLVIIGVAGGVVLHATWEGIRGDTRDEAAKEAERAQRSEVGVQVVKRLLHGRDAVKNETEVDSNEVKTVASKELDFSSFEPETKLALETFTNAVIKDYVHYWYDLTIPSELSFPASCRQTLVAFLLSLSNHLRRKRPADAFLDFVTNASSIIIVFLTELAAAMNASPNSNAEDAINTYLSLKPDSSLSYLLDEDSQRTRLADAAEDILQAYLDPKAYNCPPVHAFLKQILAQLCLGYTVTYCSDATFINEWIVYGLEESETTKEVMNMVDAGVEGRTAEKSAKQAVAEVEKVEETAQVVQSKKEGLMQERPPMDHRRKTSKAEEAMDEAMREARRLTQMMIEEDEKRAKEEAEKEAAGSSSADLVATAVSSSEDVSGANMQGVATPTSSQSDKERQEEEVGAWTAAESTTGESATSRGSEEEPKTPSSTTHQQFTSFDQILPQAQPTALDPSSPRKSRSEARPDPPQLTLHNAIISIFDDSMPGDKTSIKAKPATDYLIQIEPASSAFPGWMISRRYPDFEILHEVLRRISVITGVKGFTAAHADLPHFKGNTKSGLREELEKYLTDAVKFQPLAESEGMKRFLEKDQGLQKSPGSNSKGFGWPTPDAFGKFGGDMMGVLTKAPKSVAGGGKAVFGGVAGLVGGGKRTNNPAALSRCGTGSIESPGGHRSQASVASNGAFGSMAAARQSQESLRSPARPSARRTDSTATMSSINTSTAEFRARGSVSSSRQSVEVARSSEASAENSQPVSRESTVPDLAGMGLDGGITLPPPPSEMADDFSSAGVVGKKSLEMQRPTKEQDTELVAPAPALPQRPEPTDAIQPPTTPTKPSATKPKKAPLTDRETSVAVELTFALITTLYTLSSAWQIRLTLLTAAKNFLLRPGNPQLVSIKEMLQTSLLDHNLSDSGIAGHLYKLRENALPTEKEMEIWRRDYPEKTADQKEELRVKARKLLVEKGMPQALTSVMGAAASGEALGRVFDALQVPAVAKGVVGGVLLQAVRTLTQ